MAFVDGVGFNIHWQDGPRGQDERRPAQSGRPAPWSRTSWVNAVIQRLEFYQRSQFACSENREALKRLRVAREFMEKRNSDRADRGVEGLNKE